MSCWECGFEVQEELDQATLWQLCQSLPAAEDLLWRRGGGARWTLGSEGGIMM